MPKTSSTVNKPTLYTCLMRTMADWTCTYEVKGFTADLDFEYTGPGWYRNKEDYLLVLRASDYHVLVQAYVGRDPRSDFLAIAKLPIRETRG